MKLPRLFKPKTQALPVAEWVDYAAIQALQDQATAALAINEPLQRLLALKAAAAVITEKLEVTAEGFSVKNLLTDAGRAALDGHQKKRSSFIDAAPVFVLGGTMTGTIGAMGTAAALSASPVALMAAIFTLPVFFVGSIVGTVTYGNKRHRDTATPVLVDVLAPLLETYARLDAAVTELETTLSLSEARQSAYFQAALAASPSLKDRFTLEAGKAALLGDAPTVAKPIAKKTTLSRG